MSHSVLKSVQRLFAVPVNDRELVRAQFKAFAKQIPLLYFILAINTLAIVFICAKFGHPWVSTYIPLALCGLCAVRGVKWWRYDRPDAPYETALRVLRNTNKLAFVTSIAFTVWGMLLFRYGDAHARSQIVFFLGLTMISCLFCLMHLRPAVMSVTFVGVIPFTIVFFFADQGHFRALALNMALVAIGMIAILMIYYRDFAQLVASQSALINKQAETQKLSDENLELANVDPLSRLPNRRALMATLSAWHADCGKPGAITAIVFVDLDGFKDVNDVYGHETGDKLITIVAARFSALLPEEAILARFGGDEFAAVISSTRAVALAQAFATTLVDLLRQPIRIGERTIQIGASVGVSHAAPAECDAQELFRRADVAMYAVKAAGKSGLKFYSPELDAERLRQKNTEIEIREGLAAEEFEVHYQPIVAAETKAVVAVEALLRWPRRPGSPIGPDEFINVAEATGLIHPLGLFVLRRACLDLREIDGVGLSVNVSPAQFRDPDFEAKVAKILAETRFPAERLELELTEGYLIDHPQRASGAISAFKAMGVSVALDDFGAGYTSIAYLQQYGFDRIKIDKSLATQIASSRKASVLITGTVYIAHGLDMDVTAEGVETEEQESLLRLAGCKYLQGFRYFRPSPIGELFESEVLPRPTAVFAKPFAAKQEAFGI